MRENAITLMRDRAKQQPIVKELASKIFQYVSEDISTFPLKTLKRLKDNFKALENLYAEALALAVLNEVEKTLEYDETTK